MLGCGKKNPREVVLCLKLKLGRISGFHKLKENIMKDSDSPDSHLHTWDKAES